MKRVFALLALFLTLATTPPAWAQVPPPVMDQVVLDLTAEDWVGTETARVTVSADAAASGADAGTQRSDLLTAINGLTPGTQWRIVSFDRSTDQAGLERWRALAEVRLPETALGGLSDKARQASRPGLQLRIGSIEFAPTLAETEAVRARLRAEIYGKAASELDALERSFPGRKFRIGNIDFANEPPMAYARKTREDMQPMAMAAAPAQDGPVNVSEKLVVRARVVLSAVAPRE
jgi:hypothetical protein